MHTTKMIYDLSQEIDLPLPPPSEPPPLLSSEDIVHLIEHGYLAVKPPHHLITLYDKLSRAASCFFDEEIEVKRRLYPASQGTELGFYDIKGEKQYLTIRQRNQFQAEDFEKSAGYSSIASASSAEEYQSVAELAHQLDDIAVALYTQTSAYLHRILCDISLSLIHI